MNQLTISAGRKMNQMKAKKDLLIIGTYETNYCHCHEF